MRKTADRMDHIEGSVIRKFAEAALKPGMISFANGNPSPATYPVADMKRFFDEALESDEAESLLRYGSVQGYPPLVAFLKERLTKKFGFDFDRNELFIVSGGTQAVDITSKIWLERGDAVITEEPSYASCYNIFRSYEAELVGVPIGEAGIDVRDAEEALRAHPNTRLIYTIPSFQNPTGFTAAEENRRQLYELARRYDVVILEDDPYAELRFAGETRAPIKSYDQDGRVFYASSLSKVIAPSFRLGYLVVDRSFAPYVNVCKQCEDVHSNTLAQYVAWAVMTKTDYESHIRLAQDEYRRKSALVTRALERTMHPSVRLSQPTGGLFLMMFLPDDIDASDFAGRAIERGVVCVPGSGFALDAAKPSHSIRLCYSTETDENLVRGAEILGQLTRDMIEGRA